MQGLGLELFGYPYDSTFLNLFELVDLCWTIAYATPFLQRLLKELGPLGGPQAFAPASPTLNSARSAPPPFAGPATPTAGEATAWRSAAAAPQQNRPFLRLDPQAAPLGQLVLLASSR